MPVNLYDDRKVSLRRWYGNGDLDIVRASYTRHKANVTEALAPLYANEVYSVIDFGNLKYQEISEI